MANILSKSKQRKFSRCIIISVMKLCTRNYFVKGYPNETNSRIIIRSKLRGYLREHFHGNARHWYFMSENRVPFQRIYFISRAIRAWISAERCSPLPLFFHDRRISWQFLLHLRHALSYREKLFFFFCRARNYFFTTVVFASDDWPVSAKSVYQFPRALRASLRCITVTISRVLVAIEKIDERCDELVGGVSSCEKKRDKADRPPHQWWWR